MHDINITYWASSFIASTILTIPIILLFEMIQNLLWTTEYNTITIPLAAYILYSQRILLPPALGAIIMP